MRQTSPLGRRIAQLVGVTLIVGVLTAIDGAPASAAISFVQTVGKTQGGSHVEIDLAFSSGNTAGNTIIIAVAWASNATMTCTDTRGNSYTTITTDYDSTNVRSLGICYASNVAAGANTVTANFSGASTNRRIILHEYSGILNASFVVNATAQNIANGTTATDAITSGSATTTVDGSLIFGAAMNGGGTTTITPGTGFTQRGTIGSQLGTQDMVQTTAGSIASTQTFADAHRYLAQMVAFTSDMSEEEQTTVSAIVDPSLLLRLAPMPGPVTLRLNQVESPSEPHRSVSGTRMQACSRWVRRTSPLPRTLRMVSPCMRAHRERCKP